MERFKYSFFELTYKKEVMMNKRAISPLIATILLIAFAIALGLVVMNWGKSYIEEKAEFTVGPQDLSACNLIQLEFIQVGGENKICFNSDTLIVEAFLENGPDRAIDNFDVRVIGNTIETISSVLQAPIGEGVSAQVKFNYPESIGLVQQVRITPIVNIEGGPIPCQSQAISADHIKPC